MSSTHSGSFLRAEISLTTSSDRPRRALAPATSESAQPNLYVPSPSSWSFAVVVMSGALRTRQCLLCFVGYNFVSYPGYNCAGCARLPVGVPGDMGGADSVP